MYTAMGDEGPGWSLEEADEFAGYPTTGRFRVIEQFGCEPNERSKRRGDRFHSRALKSHELRPDAQLILSV